MPKTPEGPMELLVLSFDDASKADEALHELRELKKQKLIQIEDATVIIKDAQGKGKFKEIHDLKGQQGALLGAIGGGLVGLLAGPVGLLAGAAIGAAGGGLAAALHDAGFSTDDLRLLEDRLPANSSALLALIEHRWVKDLMNEVSQAAVASSAQQMQITLGGDLGQITDRINQQMAAGRMPPPAETQPTQPTQPAP